VQDIGIALKLSRNLLFYVSVLCAKLVSGVLTASGGMLFQSVYMLLICGLSEEKF